VAWAVGLFRFSIGCFPFLIHSIPGCPIFMSGVCPQNTGPGGFGVVLLRPDGIFELSGLDSQTTSDRVQLSGAIAALDSVPVQSSIRVLSDSAYLVHAFTRGLLKKWKKSFWRRSSDDEQVENYDLWQRLMKSVERHDSIRWRWMRGSGDVYREHAHSLANAAVDGKSVPLLRPATLGSRVSGPRSTAYSSISF
jgi:ribonuclease HI